jgi:phage portal protein BeeE
MLGMIRWLFGGEAQRKAAGGSFVTSLFSSQATYPPMGYRTNADDGYAGCEIVFACINLIASSFAEAPLRVIDTAGEVHTQDHTALLMRRPNPHLSQYDL